MKVGDLVKHLYGVVPGHGIIIEPPDKTLCEAKTIWDDGRIRTLPAGWLEVVSVSR